MPESSSSFARRMVNWCGSWRNRSKNSAIFACAKSVSLAPLNLLYPFQAALVRTTRLTTAMMLPIESGNWDYR